MGGPVSVPWGRFSEISLTMPKFTRLVPFVVLAVAGILWLALRAPEPSKLKAGQPETQAPRWEGQAPAELEVATSPEAVESRSAGVSPDTEVEPAAPGSKLAGAESAPEEELLEDDGDVAFELHFRVVDTAGLPLERSLDVSLPGLPKQYTWLAQSDSDGWVEAKITGVIRPTAAFDLQVSSTQPDGAFGERLGLRLATENVLVLGSLVLTTPEEDNPTPLVTGFVLGEMGQPIPGATGRVLGGRFNNQDWPEHRRGAVRFAQDGSFAVYGPAHTDVIRLMFEAVGYEARVLEEPELPAAGLEVILGKNRLLKGRVVVPEGWPAYSQFGVGGLFGGESISTSVRPDGTFEVGLSERLEQLQIIYPRGAGFVLYTQEWSGSEEDATDVGTIDLGLVAKQFDFLIEDPSGEPIRKAFLEAATENQTPIRNFLRTDEQGRYPLIVPNEATELILSVRGGAKVRVDLVSPPSRIELPLPE